MPRELLALIAQGLAELDPRADPQSLGGAVSTIFGQFNEFSASVTDFYTYIGSVLTRSDLEGDEWAGFKHLLVDYLDSIIESVRRHGPAIASALERLRPDVPDLLERISQADGTFAAPQAASPGSEEVQRARGRTKDDWDQLEAWFVGPGARQLRDAAHRAVGALLASLKRINASATPQRGLCDRTSSSWRPGSTQSVTGVGRHASDPHEARIVVDEEEHVEAGAAPCRR